MSLKTVFLHPPSFDGFDGGAGARYQAKREVRSFWFPTWLAQPAALVPDSVLIDAPTDGLTLAEVMPRVKDADLVIMHTSSPSFASDSIVAQQLKAANPRMLIGLVGAKVAVDPLGSLEAAPAVDFVCREEFDYTCLEVSQGKPLGQIAGLCYRGADGKVIATAARAPIEDMDALPWVTPVYQRDLKVENYFIGYLKHPYVSFYTGRGCKSRCTFCLWPQTVGGHRYPGAQPCQRDRGGRLDPEEHAAGARDLLRRRHLHRPAAPRRGDRPRPGQAGRDLVVQRQGQRSVRVVEDHARQTGCGCCWWATRPGPTRSCATSRRGCAPISRAASTRDCRELGITIHGTFILGLPGETRETIEQTIRFAKEINPHTIQVSLAAPYPGTELYRDAVTNGWLSSPDPSQLVDSSGTQLIPLSYPHLKADEIYHALERFYKSFYFRPSKIFELVAEMSTSWEMTRRRLREGVEFMRFLNRRAA